jgi:hypothetical protein
VTPYTSFLALEPGAQPDRSDREPPRSVPAGARGVTRQRPSSGAPPPSPPPPPPMVYTQEVSGKDAVAQSRSSREMQDVVTLGGAASTASVQQVGDKTFYLREGVWTDAEIRADVRLPETSVTFGSDAYYALLGRVPALGRYFALGEQVAVILDGRLYRVRPATH